MTHPSLWVREAPTLPPETGPIPDSADVVIIGGGVAGVSAALCSASNVSSCTIAAAC